MDINKNNLYINEYILKGVFWLLLMGFASRSYLSYSNEIIN